MLVKIKKGDVTMEFDSQDCLIAILLDDGSKQSVANMKNDERLILSGPLSVIRGGAAAAWQWAMTGWTKAQFMPGQVIGAGGNVVSR